jgi:hypothetical protein
MSTAVIKSKPIMQTVKTHANIPMLQEGKDHPFT